MLRTARTTLIYECNNQRYKMCLPSIGRMSIDRYERVYLPLIKVADTPFHIQGDEILAYILLLDLLG